MPKTRGAVLDWVPQKAAQQMQSDAMTRFMPKSRVAFPVVVQRNANARSSAQISAYFRSIRARQSSSRGLGRWAGDGPRAADERFDGLDGKQTAGEGGPPGIVTPLRSAVPRPRPSAPGRISLPSIRTRSRTGTLPSRYGLRLRRDRSTA